MFNTICGRSRLRCLPPFLILKSVINFRDWSKEITCYKQNVDFSLLKHRITGDAKPGMKLLNGFIEFPYRKKKRSQKMHAAKEKIGYKFKINVHNVSINRASSFYELIRSLQAKRSHSTG